MTAMEYILKNGPPRFQQDLRNDMFKLTSLQSFSCYEEGADKGHSIREKSILLQDLLTQPQRLEVEREQARQYREKFYPRSGGFSGNSGHSYDNYGGGNSSSSYGGLSQSS
jgi:ENTH domain